MSKNQVTAFDVYLSPVFIPDVKQPCLGETCFDRSMMFYG